MQIIETNLNFGAMDKRTKTEQIILHHSGVTVLQTVETIHNYHKNTNGWAGIGYHFYVRKNGSIYRGRPENMIGAHASGSNYNSIGICFEGNFEKEKMETKQLEAGKELVAYLKNKYKIDTVKGHKEVGQGTECPGKNFPLAEMKGASASGTSDKKEETKKHKIDVDGKWGPATTKRAQQVFKTTVDGIVTDQRKEYKAQNPRTNVI